MSLDHFSEAGTSVLRSATDHAWALGHNYIGTEHLLLAELGREEAAGYGPLVGRGITTQAVVSHVVAHLGALTGEADALRALGIDPEALLEHARTDLGLELHIQGLTPFRPRLPPGADPATFEGALPLTPRVFKVLNLAIGIALHDPVEPQHLLQALLEEDGGLAVVVLDRLDVDLDALQAEVSQHR